jgi:hypothetical protein
MGQIAELLTIGQTGRHPASGRSKAAKFRHNVAVADCGERFADLVARAWIISLPDREKEIEHKP